jgi:hypothetical protein
MMEGSATSSGDNMFSRTMFAACLPLWHERILEERLLPLRRRKIHSKNGTETNEESPEGACAEHAQASQCGCKSITRYIARQLSLSGPSGASNSSTPGSGGRECDHRSFKPGGQFNIGARD